MAPLSFEVHPESSAALSSRRCRSSLDLPVPEPISLILVDPLRAYLSLLPSPNLLLSYPMGIGALSLSFLINLPDFNLAEWSNWDRIKPFICRP